MHFLPLIGLFLPSYEYKYAFAECGRSTLEGNEFRMPKRAICLGLVLTFFSLWSSVVQADYLSNFRACRSERDPMRRLACFDSVEVPPSSANEAEQPIKPSQPVSFSLGRFAIDNEGITTFARVRFTPTFANFSNKEVVALTFNLRITNAFGQDIIVTKKDLDIIIPAGKIIQSPKYYFWEKNPASESDFDALIGPISTGRAIANVQIERVAFSDGTIENY
ncbi:hypothetical protein PY650_02930 [Rhizobium calliandrae]|uniref:DUF4352 domain-containing protein n=1 Tax=Rhizobium calliandrae TaxID=1312182 RepID=A0ABT7K7P6_9HYPH|nr:hypothetical protein [Rhizobium calliandrae]MDL2404625.1 hypothetical protein [Rhizobium calliandrae]